MILDIVLTSCLLAVLLPSTTAMKLSPMCDVGEDYHLITYDNENIDVIDLCLRGSYRISLPHDLARTPAKDRSFWFDVHPKDNVIFFFFDMKLYLAIGDFLHSRSLDETIKQVNSKYLSNNKIHSFHHSLTDHHLVATFDPDYKIKLGTIDWVNDLLYMASSNMIYVSSLRNHQNEVNFLVHRDLATIVSIHVCERLQRLLWLEIDWKDRNVNRLQMSLLDGTEMVTIFNSTTQLTRVRIDQEHSTVYFHDNNQLFKMQLWKNPKRIIAELFKPSSADDYFVVNEMLFEKSGKTLTKTSAIFFKSFSDESAPLYESRLLEASKAMMIVHTQASLDIDTYCHDIECENFCVPNGHIAKYNCYCWRAIVGCKDYGLYETIKLGREEEEAEEEEEMRPTARPALLTRANSTIDDDVEDAEAAHLVRNKSHTNGSITTTTTTTIDDTHEHERADNVRNVSTAPNIGHDHNSSSSSPRQHYPWHHHSRLQRVLSYEEQVVFIYGLLGTLFVFILALCVAFTMLRWHHRKMSLRISHPPKDQAISGLSFRLNKLNKSKVADEKIRKLMFDRYVSEGKVAADAAKVIMTSDYVVPVRSAAKEYVNTQPGANVLNWQYQHVRTQLDGNNNFV